MHITVGRHHQSSQMILQRPKREVLCSFVIAQDMVQRSRSLLSDAGRIGTWFWMTRGQPLIFSVP